ncbi:unnamed protein product [Rotaria sordida]|uniref:Uncharacterized protein n=1 Tax=Rotaria sordida TaxID=392033 RepID=A0A819J765_9BILA|nr:unnamed protein product [Rotaria sordida]
MNDRQYKAVERDNFICNCIKTGYQGTFCQQGCHDTKDSCQNGRLSADNQCLYNLLTKENSPLKIWLIIDLCIVNIIIIASLIYSHKKLFKLQEQRSNSINTELNYKSNRK